LDSYGRGAGARFRIEAPGPDRWQDMTLVEVERPYRIVAFGRGGKFNRVKTTTIYTLEEAGPGATRVEVMTESEPPLPTDKLMEILTFYRGWTRRSLGRAMRRLQAILEENEDRGARATVAGGSH